MNKTKRKWGYKLSHLKKKERKEVQCRAVTRQTFYTLITFSSPLGLVYTVKTHGVILNKLGRVEISVRQIRGRKHFWRSTLQKKKTSYTRKSVQFIAPHHRASSREGEGLNLDSSKSVVFRDLPKRQKSFVWSCHSSGRRPSETEIVAPVTRF